MAFSAMFVVMFSFTFIFLGVVDALPEPALSRVSNGIKVPQEAVVATEPELPVRVEVRGVGVNATVSNPNSTNVNTLDQALTKGAVRYPTSAQLGEVGTVLLFGHSSYLPVVYNKAYQAFNEIGKLEKGDIVSVYSSTLEYRYRVMSVEVADASEDVIELPQEGKRLILVTCDTFTKKSSRFIVRAEFVGTYPLASN